MANINWRTIDIDALDPESSKSFDISSLAPALPQTSAAEVQNIGQQIRQLLRGGDAEGALRGAMEMAPYGGDSGSKVSHSQSQAKRAGLWCPRSKQCLALRT
jgi:actin related protein 2/3 complex subunit 5